MKTQQKFHKFYCSKNKILSSEVCLRNRFQYLTIHKERHWQPHRFLKVRLLVIFFISYIETTHQTKIFFFM